MRVNTEFSRLLKIPSASVTSVDVGEAEVVIGVRMRSRNLTCPCGYQTSARYDQSRRRWRHLDLATCKTWLVADIRRLKCPTCGVRTEEVAWARPRARHTQAFEEQTVWLASRTDKTTVATLMRCSWAAVSAMVQRVVAGLLTDQRFHGITDIGVDEKCYRHPHQYLTIVGNHATKSVVWVAPDRSAAALETFYDRLGVNGCQRLRAVSMDMAPAWITATQKRAPQARLCFDPFHIIQWANRALDSVFAAATTMRRDLTFTSKQWRQARWALRRGQERLDDERRALVNAMHRTDRHVGRAHALKEELRDLYRTVEPQQARDHLRTWITKAKRSRIPAFVQLAKRVHKNYEGIITAVEYGISNSLIEGINAKINLINARGYGHHSLQSLAAMIYLCLGDIKVKLPTQT